MPSTTPALTKARADEQARQSASDLRHRLDLGNAPIGDALALCDRLPDLDVAVLEVGDSNEHGMLAFDSVTNRYFMGVAATPHAMRQRSSIAHELGHLLLDDATAAAAVSPELVEWRAEAFAGHLLAPIEGIENLSIGVSEFSDEHVARLCQHFLVSCSLIAVQLGKGGLVSRSRQRQLLELSTPALAKRFGWDTTYRLLSNETLTPRPPRRLLARAIRAYEDGLMSETTIEQLQGSPLTELPDIPRRKLERRIAAPPLLPPVAQDLPDFDALWSDGAEH